MTRHLHPTASVETVATQQAVKPTWVKALDDGRYDFGFVETFEDRRQDKLVRLGSCDSHAAACMLAAAPKMQAALEGISPHLGAIICYASTCGEHDPNRLAKAVEDALCTARAAQVQA